MSEHADTSLFPAASFDFFGNRRPYAAQPCFSLLRRTGRCDELPAAFPRAFRNNNDRKMLAVFFAIRNLATNRVVTKRYLGYQNDIRPAGDARKYRNPTSIAPH